MHGIIIINRKLLLQRYIIKSLLTVYRKIFGTRSYGGHALASSCILRHMNSCRIFYDIQSIKYNYSYPLIDAIIVPGICKNVDHISGWFCFIHLCSPFSRFYVTYFGPSQWMCQKREIPAKNHPTTAKLGLPYSCPETQT